MRYLQSISIVLLLSACSGPYTAMRTLPPEHSCLPSLKPVFTHALYNTTVNVVGKHLSGLLIFKTMPDSSIRIVFSSEAGFKFFDFGFSGHDFKVYSIYREMNKKPVIKTLRKDFQLLLMSFADSSAGYLLKSNNTSNNNRYYAFPRGRDRYYYITDRACQRLVGMERGTKRKPVMAAVAEGFKEGAPDTIGISHRNFNFDIGLKRIYNYAEK